MKLRSIPPRTCITLAREGKLCLSPPQRGLGGGFLSVARDWKHSEASEPKLLGKRGKMRPQISRKPFEEKLSKLQDELSELTYLAIEGFDVSKLKNDIESQIKRLLQLLGGEL